MIVTFDEEQFSETDLRSFVSQAMPRPPARVSLRFLAGQGLGY